MTAPQETKVLHVDDSPTARHRVGRVLHEAGFEVVEAASIREALARLSVGHRRSRAQAARAGDDPDLIILDVNLPQTSGLEVCRRLRSR